MFNAYDNSKFYSFKEKGYFAGKKNVKITMERINFTLFIFFLIITFKELLHIMFGVCKTKQNKTK